MLIPYVNSNLLRHKFIAILSIVKILKENPRNSFEMIVIVLLNICRKTRYRNKFGVLIED